MTVRLWPQMLWLLKGKIEEAERVAVALGSSFGVGFQGLPS